MIGSEGPVALSSIHFSCMFTGETIISAFFCSKYLLSGKRTWPRQKMQQTEGLPAGKSKENPP